MPYIKQSQRTQVERLIGRLGQGLLGPGELNYAITRICQDYMDDVSYEQINAVVGVLECVKQEFYRRLAAPYEDRKAAENGDIY